MAKREIRDRGDGQQSEQRRETLNYLSDIIKELRTLADRGGHGTLSAILSAALVEVHTQIDEEGR